MFSEEIDFIFDHFVSFFVTQKMELDFDASNLVEEEAAEVGHNVSVEIGLYGLVSSLLVELIMGLPFTFRTWNSNL